MSSLLDAIVASARRAAALREATVPMEALPVPPRRAPGGFRRALESGGRPRVIAECKRRSPSRGVLREDYVPARMAEAYAAAGAAAISVLTEPAFFDGDLAHLRAVRAAVETPLLRKDFLVTRYQLAEARAAGADAVLLIAAALDAGALRALIDAAGELELDALVEVHDARELDDALEAGARIVGVNSRNLHDLSVDPSVLIDLAPRMPADVIAVAESGIQDGHVVAALARAGYRGFLIGERLVTAADPGQALRRLIDDAREAAA